MAISEISGANTVTVPFAGQVNLNASTSETQWICFLVTKTASFPDEPRNKRANEFIRKTRYGFSL